MRTQTCGITIYTVLYYDARSPGAAEDYHHIARYRSKARAEVFARGKECYGKPATVETEEVPARCADRWTFQG